MRGASWFLRLAVPLTLLTGCGVEREPVTILGHVVPASAYSDATTAIALTGGPFRPALEVDTQTGAAEVGKGRFTVALQPIEHSDGRSAIPALDAHWRSSDQVDARIPEGVPPGNYIVQMNDPRGQAVLSTVVFTSLGPDIDPPTIVFRRPGDDSAVGGGEKVSVSACVSDGAGHVGLVRWLASWSAPPGLPDHRDDDCTVVEEPPCAAVCNFSFLAPPPALDMDLKPIDIRVDAWDSVQNHGSSTLRIHIARSPRITSLAPDAGPTTGGTQIVVQGAGFIANLSQILIDGQPIGGEVEGGGTIIRATTGPHGPSDAAVVTVANGGSLSGDKLFHFIPPPKLREVRPSSGAPNVWTQVTLAGDHLRDVTTFYWRKGGPLYPVIPDPLPDPLPATLFVVFENENRVTLTLPPGSGVISIIAIDPVSGSSEIGHAFSYVDPPVP